MIRSSHVYSRTKNHRRRLLRTVNGLLPSLFRKNVTSQWPMELIKPARAACLPAQQQDCLASSSFACHKDNPSQLDSFRLQTESYAKQSNASMYSGQ